MLMVGCAQDAIANAAPRGWTLAISDVSLGTDAVQLSDFQAYGDPATGRLTAVDCRMVLNSDTMKVRVGVWGACVCVCVCPGTHLCECGCDCVLFCVCVRMPVCIGECIGVPVRVHLTKVAVWIAFAMRAWSQAMLSTR